jgi:tellurite resistance protein TerC
VFAVLGLNSLFFALRGLMGLFRFLKHGVSLILFFIGSRMIAAMYGPLERWFQGRSQVSLAVIGTILVSSIAVSVWHARLHPSGSASD